MAQYGLDVNMTIRRLNNDLKQLMSNNNKISLRQLKSMFQQADQQKENTLSQSLFSKILQNIGFSPKLQDLQILLKFYDKKQEGKINYQQYLNDINTPMNERRKSLIEKVFQIYDKEQKGKLDVSYLKEHMDISENKDLIFSKRSREEIINIFLKNFNSSQISLEDLIEYYDEMSIKFGSDEHFIEEVKQIWNVEEDPIEKISVLSLNRCLANFRQKIQSKCQKHNEENTLREVFRKYDLKQQGILRFNELQYMVIELQVDIDRQTLIAFFKHLDTNNNGYIQFNQLVYFLFQNPYK